MAKAKESTTNTALARIGGGAGGAIAIADVADYAIIGIAESGGGDVRMALEENLGSTTLSAFDFQRIRVPAGGGVAWELMDPDTAEVTASTSFEGLIVSWKDQKSFWKDGLDQAGAVQGPPNCYSLDTIQGIGDPGMQCALCPHNVFGTAKGGTGRGKACKDVRLLFVCRPGDVLPELVPVPPTSLKNVKSYFTRLAARGIPYWRAVTRFKLTPDKNAAGIKYAKIDLECVGKLDDTQMPHVREYSATIKRMLGNATVQVKPGDVGGNDSANQVGGDTVDGEAGSPDDGAPGDDDRSADVV